MSQVSGYEWAKGEAKLISQKRWPIAREGFPFLIPFALITVFFLAMGWNLLTFFGIFITLFIAFFFRNPKRKIPSLENIILSPADGKIIHVGECEEDRFLKKKVLKVSIFMSLFDVHLNRSPASGKVIESKLSSGQVFCGKCGKIVLA